MGAIKPNLGKSKRMSQSFYLKCFHSMSTIYSNDKRIKINVATNKITIIQTINQGVWVEALTDHNHKG